jgi:hypothetical protein
MHLVPASFIAASSCHPAFGQHNVKPPQHAIKAWQSVMLKNDPWRHWRTPPAFAITR